MHHFVAVPRKVSRRFHRCYKVGKTYMTSREITRRPTCTLLASTVGFKPRPFDSKKKPWSPYRQFLSLHERWFCCCYFCCCVVADFSFVMWMLILLLLSMLLILLLLLLLQSSSFSSLFAAHIFSLFANRGWYWIGRTFKWTNLQLVAEKHV